MRMDHLFTRRPGEDCEATVLRCYQGQRIPLILDELRRRQVSGAAGLYGVDRYRFVAHYGFCRYYLLNRCGSLRPSDCCSEGVNFILVIHHRCTVHGRESGHGVDGSSDCRNQKVLIRIIHLLLHQTRER